MNAPGVGLAIILLLESASAGFGGGIEACAVSDTVRYLRAAPLGGSRSVELACAKNEWVSFQILLRSPEAIGGIEVIAGDLVGPGGAKIRGADAVLYREHQLELTLASYRNDQFEPGWYPDALIPLRHPLTNGPLTGGKLGAVPFDLPPGETHGFWVDVHVPSDATAGEYIGRYGVRADRGEVASIEVALTVWDFQLPATPSMQTALGSPGDRLRSYYRRRAKEGKEPEPADWDAVDAQIAEELCRHHINATPPPALVTPAKLADGKFAFSEPQIEDLRRFIDRYKVNAIQTPHPRGVIKDPIADGATLRAWLESFGSLSGALDRPGVVFFTYLKDEPNDEEAYRYVQTWGAAIRSANSPVKVMVVEQTKTQNEKWGTLYGAVDIWCPLFPLHDQETASQRMVLGEKIWTYTALCQRDPTPWWQIDFPLLNYRAPAWIAWRHGMCGILYWGGMAHWSGVENPWMDSKTLDRRKDGRGPLYQGEGTLVYPGRHAGYDGIAPSMRLKALRDGIEDYEYLAMLERKGLGSAARAIVMPLAESWFKWERDPRAYTAARAKLASLILAGK